MSRAVRHSGSEGEGGNGEGGGGGDGDGGGGAAGEGGRVEAEATVVAVGAISARLVLGTGPSVITRPIGREACARRAVGRSDARVVAD